MNYILKSDIIQSHILLGIGLFLFCIIIDMITILVGIRVQLFREQQHVNYRKQ